MIANNCRLTRTAAVRSGPRDRQVYGFQCDTLFMDLLNGLSLRQFPLDDGRSALSR